MSETKTRILDAAESLFSERGYAGTSVRDITQRAGVNLAAANYHFGSKDELVREVFRRRFDPLNRERLALLDAAEAAGEGTAPLDAVVHAMVAPALRLGSEAGSSVVRLMGRLHSEPPTFVAELFRELFSEVRSRFTLALGRSATHLDPGSAFMRMFFSVGAMAHAMCYAGRMAVISEETAEFDQPDRLEAELIHFCVAGLSAPLLTGPLRAGARGGQQ